MIYKEISQLTGKTPMMELLNYEKEKNLNARIVAKLEFFNPAGSSKDRVAVKMIDEAEKAGILKKGSVVIEPTSGNTGIGLASVCASRGYEIILTMPETMSVERRNLLSAYGAQIVLTDGKKGMNGAIEKAKELAETIPNSFIPSQFDNPANARAHEETTGPEIWSDTDGKIDAFGNAAAFNEKTDLCRQCFRKRYQRKRYCRKKQTLCRAGFFCRRKRRRHHSHLRQNRSRACRIAARRPCDVS